MWTDSNDAILAVVDALKSVCGVLAAQDPSLGEQLCQSFESQGKTYLEQHNPDGALVMSFLLQHLGNQEAAQRLHQMKPRGSA